MQSRQLCMNVTKIFNWTDNFQKNTFELYFYSAHTNQLIIKRIIHGILSASMMYLNCLLRINYTQDQNQILLKLKYRQQLLGQFSINLQILESKKVQYFPFGHRDKVLQINLSNQKNNLNINRLNSDKNYNFLHDRQQFLKNAFNIQQKLKRNFSEKINGLITSPRSNKIYSNRYYLEKIDNGNNIDNNLENQNYNNKQKKYNKNNQYSSPYTNKQHVRQHKFKYQNQRQDKYRYNDYQNKMKKSRSENALLGQVYQNSKRQSSHQGRSSTSSQNNKLILNTLNVVPSQQYFDKTHQKNKIEENKINSWKYKKQQHQDQYFLNAYK